MKCLSTAGVAAISSFVSGLPPKKNDRLAELYPHILLGLKPFSNEIVAGAQDSSRVRCPFHFVISLKVGKVFKTFFVCHGCICELYDLSHSRLERAIKAAKIQIAADQTGNLNGLTLPPRASANGRGPGHPTNFKEALAYYQRLGIDVSKLEHKDVALLIMPDTVKARDWYDYFDKEILSLSQHQPHKKERHLHVSHNWKSLCKKYAQHELAAGRFGFDVSTFRKLRRDIFPFVKIIKGGSVTGHCIDCATLE